MLIALAPLIITATNRVSLTSNIPLQDLLAYPTDPVFLTLLMYDIRENGFEIPRTTCSLGLLNRLGDLGVLEVVDLEPKLSKRIHGFVTFVFIDI